MKLAASFTWTIAVNRIRSLSEIYQKYAGVTDKGTTHSYIEFYEAVLAEYRYRPVTLLEIGVDQGGSLRLWQEYLHGESRIIGVDYRHVNGIGGNIEIIQADATLPEWVNRIGPVDIVIDDASHRCQDQIAVFRHLWPRLRDGGIYVIEDVQDDEAERAIVDVMPNAMVEDWRASAKKRYDDRIVWTKKPVPYRDAKPCKQKIIVLNVQNDDYRHIFELTEHNKRSYCERHGYEFRVEWLSRDMPRRPHWGRIDVIRKNLPDCDWLFYLDTDIIITNPLFRVESYIDESFDQIVGRMPTAQHASTSGILLRNCEWSYRMLDCWQSPENAVDYWYSDSDCTRGGGPFVDQSGWHKMYDTVEWVRERTKILPVGQKNFNNESWTWQPGDWLLHVPGISTADKAAELERRLAWTR